MCYLFNSIAIGFFGFIEIVCHRQKVRLIFIRIDSIEWESKICVLCLCAFVCLFADNEIVNIYSHLVYEWKETELYHNCDRKNNSQLDNFNFSMQSSREWQYIVGKEILNFCLVEVSFIDSTGSTSEIDRNRILITLHR